MKDKDLKLLYRSFDDALPEKERACLEKALNDSDALRQEKERLADIRESIGRRKSEGFSPYFSQRVMARIRENQAEPQGELYETLVSFFRPVMVGTAVLTILLASYNIMKSRRVTLASVFAEPEITVEEAFDPMNSSMWESY